MTLRLTGPLAIKVCPECAGARVVPCPKTYAADGRLVPSVGVRIPCPACKGRGVVPA